MTDAFTTGIGLSRACFDEVVGPIVFARFPGLPCAAGRLGSGSDVLGLDDVVSRDHDWGLRLSLLVPADAVAPVRAELDAHLPASFRGLPTRFPFTGEDADRHHIEVSTTRAFLTARLGFDPRASVELRDWLSLTGQAVLEVIAGPVFVDTAGELAAARRALRWYPDDVWRYALACDWDRMAQELPLLGRAGDLGDDLGSRVIAARLVHVVMHLAFLLERRWAPYAKWFGTVFGELPVARELSASLGGALGALGAGDVATRQRGIADALAVLLRRQNELGLTDVGLATIPFWGRPYLQPDPRIATELLEPIADADVIALPRGRGTIEQRTDNVDVLVDPGARRRAVLS